MGYHLYDIILTGENMATISLKLNKEQLDLLKKLYQDDVSNAEHSLYISDIYHPYDCVITVYNSGKVVFQGKEADYHAAPFMVTQDFFEHAGSDEVGTGDYYGPICVCACIVEKKHQALLDQLEIRDSKALKDDKICLIAPSLIKHLTHSLLILNNTKYNQIQVDNNMNKIKARMHNQAYLNLAQKQQLPKNIIIDQFTPEANYYRYLDGEKNIINGITFETKAEDKYLAVGCGSIIARYAFLQSMAQMDKHYDWSFPKGASSRVDENAKEFIKKYGKAELAKVAKLNFKNTTRVFEDK